MEMLLMIAAAVLIAPFVIVAVLACVIVALEAIVWSVIGMGALFGLGFSAAVKNNSEE